MLIIKQTRLQRARRKLAERTVDSDGDDLGKSEAVGTLEGGDLAKGAQLAVLSRLVESSSRVRLSLNQLKLNVVGLSRDEAGNGATVLLGSLSARCSQQVAKRKLFQSL